MDRGHETDPWGVPTMELFGRFRDSLDENRAGAVATVVHVEGSAYRRPGAKMYFAGEGASFGGITAGCLEGPLRELADEVIAEDVAIVRTFDLTDGGEWDIGLGCNGIVTVLIEPLDPSWVDVVDAVHAGESRTVVTALEATDSYPIGARAVVDAAGDRIDVEGRPELPVDLELPDVPRAQRRPLDVDGDAVPCFIDPIDPPTRLVVFGAQPDVRAVTRFARAVGLHVTVATPRGGTADDRTFPAAHEVVATHPDDLDEIVDSRSHVVIMSHNYVDDLLALETLLDTEAPYIGLMGPRKRFEELRGDLVDGGVELTEDDRSRIATPVGLDLGGGEPVEVAMSVVAEVVAVSNGRAGGRLRDRDGPIHERVSPQPN